MLLAPGRSASCENVRRSAIAVVTKCPGDDRIAVNGYTCAKLIAGRAVASSQLLLLTPNGSASNKHICRTLIGARDIVQIGSNDRRIAADRDAPAKVIIRCAVRSDELLLLRPGISAANVDVCSACVAIVPIRPDDRVITTDRDTVSELIERRRVRRRDFRRLAKSFGFRYC